MKELTDSFVEGVRNVEYKISVALVEELYDCITIETKAFILTTKKEVKEERFIKDEGVIIL